MDDCLLRTKIYSPCHHTLRLHWEDNSSRHRVRGSLYPTKNPKSFHVFSNTFTCVHQWCIIHLGYLSSINIFTEGWLLSPFDSQQTPKLLGTRGCREIPQPRKSRWSRVSRGYKLYIQRERIPLEGYSHILCSGEVWSWWTQTRCSSEAGFTEWNRGCHNSS